MDCECPEQCNEMTFSRQISFGTLGSQALDHILSGNTSGLGDRVAQAAAANALKDASSYVRDRDIFDEISELLTSLLKVVDGLWLSRSPQNNVDNTIDKIDKAANFSFNTYINDYTTVFDERLKNEINDTLSKSAHILSSMSIIQQTLEKWTYKVDLLFVSEIQGQTIINATKSSIREEMVEDFQTAVLILEMIHRNDYRRFPKIKECIDILDMTGLKRTVRRINELLSQPFLIKEDVNAELKYFDNARDSLYCVRKNRDEVAHLRSQLLSLSPEKTVLETKKELKQLRVNLYVRELRVPIVHIQQSYDRLIKQFMTGKLKKVKVVLKIASDILPKMTINTKVTLAQISSLFLNPYGSKLAAAFRVLKHNYVELYKTLNKLMDFLPNADIPARRNLMKIWTRPLIQLSPSVSERNIRKISQAKIKFYLNTSVDEVTKIVEEHIAAFNEPIINSLTKYRNNLIEMELKLDSVAGTIREAAETSAKSTTLDADFVR